MELFEVTLMLNDFPAGLHVAIIMDGNGRWAARRGLPRVAGHRAGLAAARRIVEHAPDIGIACLTLYAFSSDNWRRPAPEVESIFWLLRAFLRLETDRLRHRGARLQVIGRRDRLPQKVLNVIEKSEAETALGRRIHLRVAIDYSSRDSIIRAACDSSREQPLSPDALRPLLSEALTADSGDVDLLIRTGGEKRLSDFLLWESAYAELLFTDRMWPDFDEADLDAAIEEFRHRERRFGSVPAAGGVGPRLVVVTP
jgi:undecaprenyl diphosphate synthase